MSLSFKVFFSPDNIRRIRLDAPVSYFQFTNLLHELYENDFHPELFLKWKDEDGDLITVSSEMEWQHLLETTKENPIKIYISEGNRGIYFKDGPPAQPLGVFESETKQKVEGENVARIETAVPHFLQSLFKGGQILPYNLPTWLQNCIQLKTLPNNELDLDVNLQELHMALHRRSLELLAGDKESVEEGKRLLLVSLEIIPSNALTLYNLACAESLLQNVSQAIECLDKAIQCGYNGFDHMEKDPDLDNIRNDLRYISLVNSVKPKPEIVQPIIVQPIKVDPIPIPQPIKVEEPPKPVEIPVKIEEPQLSVGEQKWSHYITLLKEMGFGKNDQFFGVRCVALFEQFNGDVDAVISKLFEN